MQIIITTTYLKKKKIRREYSKNRYHTLKTIITNQ